MSEVRLSAGRILVAGFASSTPAGYALQAVLAERYELTLVSQGPKILGSSPLVQLLALADEVDAAAFTFPDSLNLAAEPDYHEAMFAIGLLVSRLGPERLFLVLPTSMDIRVLPELLRGGLIARYDARRSDSNLRAALGPSAEDVRITMARIGTRSATKIETTWHSLTDDLAHATSLFVWGMNHADFIIRNFADIEDRLSHGLNLRILLARPGGEAVKLTSLRFASPIQPEQETQRILSSLRAAERLREQFPSLVQIQTYDFPFTYGAILLGSSGGESVVYVKMYTFRTWGGSGKPKSTFRKGKTQWHDLVVAEGEAFWSAASSTETSS